MTKDKILAFKRQGDPHRPLYRQRQLKHPILAVLFGWIADIILAESFIPEQPLVMTYFRATDNRPNEIAGEVSKDEWDEYCRTYNAFREMERVVQDSIISNSKIYGKPVAVNTNGKVDYDTTFKDQEAAQ